MESTGNSPLKLADLKAKMRLEGKVSKIGMAGAYIDVGLGQPGLLHISQLSRTAVNRVEDVLQEGQQVEVWVHRLDAGAGRLELTMIPPIQVDWRDLKPGARFHGKVTRLEQFGAFVDVGAERPGLVHVSEMSNEYVRNPAEVVKPGDEVEVVVLDIDRKKRQIRFSMKAVDAVSAEADEEQAEAPLPTAMEVAFRQAMQASGEAERAAAAAVQIARQRASQEELLARTLRGRVRTSSSEQ